MLSSQCQALKVDAEQRFYQLFRPIPGKLTDGITMALELYS